MFCNFLEWPTKPKQINPQSFNRFQNRNKWEYSYSTSVDRPNLANPILLSTTNHQQTIQFFTKQTILRIFFIHVCSRISHWPPSFAPPPFLLPSVLLPYDRSLHQQFGANKRPPKNIHSHPFPTFNFPVFT